MQVRFAQPDDARAVAEIHVDTWQRAYVGLVSAEFLASLSVEKSQAMWSECIANGSPQLLVASDSNQICGWVAFGPCRDEGATLETAEIWAIYVAVSQWRRGAGRQLWLHLHRELREQGFSSVALWAFPQNERAAKFYRSLGFEAEAGTSKQFTLGGSQIDEVRYARQIDA